MEVSDLVDGIGSRIRQLRENQGWSQFELARLSGVGQPSINQYESGKRTEIQLTNLIALASVFRVTLDELVGYDVNKLPEVAEREAPATARRLATFERRVTDLEARVNELQKRGGDAG